MNMSEVKGYEIKMCGVVTKRVKSLNDKCVSNTLTCSGEKKKKKNLSLDKQSV